MASLGLSLLHVTFIVTVAFPSFQGSIPNGFNVVVNGAAWNAVGHRARNRGGPKNPFGEAFADAGQTWTPELCAADSDGDGLTNGEELGDPDCVWRPGDQPARTSNITHPGIAEADEASVGGGGGGLGLQQLEAGGIATLMFLFGLAVTVAVGALVAPNAAPWQRRLLFYPGPKGLNIANLVGISVVTLGLIAYVAGLSVAQTRYQAMVALGLAAGLSMSLPIWWAFSKVGVHKAFEMSREAAWRIHIMFGDVALLFAILHGAFAFREFGASVFRQFGWICGLVGLGLILLGIAPAAAHAMAPRLVTYDRWKMMHFASLVGYVLTLVHMVDNAVKARTGKSIIVALFNILALTAYAVQFIAVKYEHKHAEVVDAVAVGEADGQHIFLRLVAPGFKYVPGQWAYLRAPSISPVAHPFTIVPDKAADHVQFFIKVSGNFTKKLAQSLSQERPLLQLQGPCGSPPALVKDKHAVVFVVGGVGVTPSLSLVAEASKSCKGAVRMYWSVRSKELLDRCAPILEPYLKPELQCIRLTTSGTSAEPLPTILGQTPRAPTPSSESQESWPELQAVLGSIMARDKAQMQACIKKVKPSVQARNHLETAPVAQLPLGASTGRADVGSWLANVAADLSAEGVNEVLLFVCGPTQLVTAVKQATKETRGIDWQLHVEQFEFLPLPKLGKSTARPKNLSAPQEP